VGGIVKMGALVADSRLDNKQAYWKPTAETIVGDGMRESQFYTPNTSLPGITDADGKHEPVSQSHVALLGELPR
jgi:hypothetical protein